MKFILLISLILLLAFISKSEANKTIGSCNCDARALVQCGTEESDCQRKCIQRYTSRCARRCSVIKRSLPACDCHTKAVEKCGADASAESRKCRNDFIPGCVKQFQDKINIVIEHNTRKITVHKPIQEPTKVTRKFERKLHNNVKKRSKKNLWF